MATTLLHRASAASSALLLCSRLAHLFFSSDDTVLLIELRIPFTGHKIEPPLRMVDTTPNELLSFLPPTWRSLPTLSTRPSSYAASATFTGQETFAVGMEATITKADGIITTYRDIPRPQQHPYRGLHRAHGPPGWALQWRGWIYLCTSIRRVLWYYKLMVDIFESYYFNFSISRLL